MFGLNTFGSILDQRNSGNSLLPQQPAPMGSSGLSYGRAAPAPLQAVGQTIGSFNKAMPMSPAPVNPLAPANQGMYAPSQPQVDQGFQAKQQQDVIQRGVDNKRFMQGYFNRY